MAFPPIRYLALGDSFTIGTGVAPDRAFPARLAARWRAEGREVDLVNPAVNGYTTDDLIARELPLVATARPTFVTLLIGANDIVRGRDEPAYRARVRSIVATLDPKTLVALPQPDWSRSPAARPFGDVPSLAARIESFNAALREEAERATARYVDLYPLMRRQAGAGMLAPDALHPSATAHEEWAAALARELAGPGLAPAG